MGGGGSLQSSEQPPAQYRHDEDPLGESPSRSPKAAPITVVIVDDHLMVAESIAEALSSYDDMTVLGIATNRASGLEAVILHRPDVLLLDQRLSDGLGTESLPTMLAVCPRMKVLMVTGDDSDDLLARAITAGAVGVVPKTERAATLLHAVRAAAHDQPVMTPAALHRLMPRLARGRRPGQDLTARELEVLTLLAAGNGTSALAGALVVTSATARNHIQSIMKKLGAHTRLEAVAIALRDNVIEAA